MGYALRMPGAWLTDLRKLALLNCILSILSMLVPAGRLVATVNTITTDHPDRWDWVIPALVAFALVTGLFLTFFWALYRDRTTIVLPAHLRLIALGAAIVLLVIGFRTFGAWAFGIRDDWSFVTQREWRTGARSLRGWLENPVTVREFASSTAIASTISYVFFLIALFRRTDGSGRSDVPVSKLLAGATKGSVVVAGLILAFLLIRVLITPYLYSQIREMAAGVGRKPPPFLYFIRDTIRDFLLGACYFTAPFLVYMSIRRGGDSQIEDG